MADGRSQSVAAERVHRMVGSDPITIIRREMKPFTPIQSSVLSPQPQGFPPAQRPSITPAAVHGTGSDIASSDDGNSARLPSPGHAAPPLPSSHAHTRFFPQRHLQSFRNSRPALPLRLGRTLISSPP